DLGGNAALGHGHGQAGFTAVMSAFDAAAVYQRPQRAVQLVLSFQVAAWRGAGLLSMNCLQVGRTAETQQRIGSIDHIAEENDSVAFILEMLRSDVLRLLD